MPPYPIVIDTGLPVAVQRGFAPEKTLDKAEAAFNEVIDDVTAFLKRAAERAALHLDADTVTLECGVSITAGATWIVELEATGEISLSATWNASRLKRTSQPQPNPAPSPDVG
jgi:hypothetical protein